MYLQKYCHTADTDFQIFHYAWAAWLKYRLVYWLFDWLNDARLQIWSRIITYIHSCFPYVGTTDDIGRCRNPQRCRSRRGRHRCLDVPDTRRRQRHSHRQSNHRPDMTNNRKWRHTLSWQRSDSVGHSRRPNDPRDTLKRSLDAIKLKLKVR